MGVPHFVENETLHLQSLFYITKPATVTELREAIEHDCTQIPWELFHDVCDSIAWHCQQCLDQNGRQFENRQGKNNKMILVKYFYTFKIIKF